VRDPARAASTSVALFVGVSLVTLMSVGAASATGAADHALDGQYPLDLTVTAPVTGSLPLSAVDRLRALPGTAAALALPGAAVTTSGGVPLEVVGADPAALARVWRTGDPGLSDGVVLISAPDATLAHVRAGGVLRLPGAGPLRVRIAAIPAATVTPAVLARVAPGAPVHQVLLRAAGGVDPSSFRTAVRREVAGTSGVRTGGSITQRAQVADAVAIVLRVVTGLLGAAVLIAVVGIANTLALSVLERSREFAVQRALGMTRRQLRASLAAEAMLLATVGAVLGVVAGIGFGWAGARAVFGRNVEVPLAVPWVRVLLTVALAAGAGVLASLLPGRRAARTTPVAALAAE